MYRLVFIFLTFRSSVESFYALVPTRATTSIYTHTHNSHTHTHTQPVIFSSFSFSCFLFLCTAPFGFWLALCLPCNSKAPSYNITTLFV
ncbi:hypothetical protein K450DRAFT_232159 [Umbelopsis ramanniana AG]|uniref:Uncharacterized protein n=1 Tax=Umbelopsis ramanniana AG TaxID=1314678 RepID=A0AAD5ECY4_UMBRA|nr:uncharacterized protein K450DRAFT_232159 [Umbelopsis ramanniana AG]KAI8581616.1 hypothetical protein K450DRAFT_232159 [Umbelopsis ramanniana AG]